MIGTRILLIFTLLVYFFPMAKSLGYETDQFTLPPYPLVDISSDISSYIHQQITKAVDKLNEEENRDEKTIYETVFKSIDGGVKLTETLEGWLGNGPFASPIIQNRYPKEHVSFRQKLNDSIYAHATFHRGFNLAFRYLFSATINMYGQQIGTDKVGHFFKQGYQYAEIYLKAREEGKSDIEAKKLAAYERGVHTENTYFGLGLSGVFSNADLFTNYTGMHFYLNLLRAVQINGITYPPMLTIHEGRIEINTDAQNSPKQLMKRFIHPHMNEAYNPSFQDPWMYKKIAKNVLKVCPQWKSQYPQYNQRVEQEQIVKFSTWFGADYGHTFYSHPEVELITVAKYCQL